MVFEAVDFVAIPDHHSSMTSSAEPSSPPAVGGALTLFAAASFLSALLVFAVQPMFAKMALPLLGGAPAVWNTAMLFFQTVLLLGYVYVHLATRLLGAKTQAWLHLAVMGLAFIALPISVATGWNRPPLDAPLIWLVGLFAVSVGLPFFAVAANAPLLQKWFSRTRHAAAGDPYFFYAASNLGSLSALVAYPTVIEPWIGRVSQSWAWTAAYAVLVALIAACALFVRPKFAAETTIVHREAISWRRRLHWLALAFVPSSLLLGVTTHITTDVAAVPLLWVIPLALYLLSFVLVFARRRPLKHEWMVNSQPILIIFYALAAQWVSDFVLAFLLVNWVVFFVTAMVCHGELVDRRPGTGHLTEFYLWLAVGGMLGGIFNVLIAPAVFHGVYEYPLILILACLLRPSGEGRFFRVLDVALPAVLLAVIAVPTVVYGFRPIDHGFLGLGILAAVGLAAYGLQRRPLRFGLAVAVILLANTLVPSPFETVTRDRSFFGVYAVKRAINGNYNLFSHGTIIHGVQYITPQLWHEPLSYYHREGPLGQFFARLDRARTIERVGVIGLGIGTVACYRQAGQDWMFFEIDPTIGRLAWNTRYFHYLSECAEGDEIVYGDARLSLNAVPDGHFDVLIQDAFSSDAIPVHLLTREALALYLRKLRPGGVIAAHVTNKYLSLSPVFANLAHDAGLFGIWQNYVVGEEERRQGKMDSTWVLMARTSADLAHLGDDSRWLPLESDSRAGLWTDDFSNLIGVLKWGCPIGKECGT